MAYLSDYSNIMTSTIIKYTVTKQYFGHHITILLEPWAILKGHVRRGKDFKNNRK